MPDTFVRTRCAACERVLTFEDFAAGGNRCLGCAKAGPRGEPRIIHRNRRPQPPPLALSEAEQYERMLDAVPDELIDELVAALEAEAAKLPPVSDNPVRDVLAEIGFGRSARERAWAAWGFAAGFGANVAVAKYAQMASGAPMRDFVGPLLIGGCVAGAACAVIGWGLARLREPA